MIASNRYLVVWVSSVTGEHTEAFPSADRAQERLDEVEQRAYFDRGVVIDQIECGAQRSPEAFRQIHESHPNRPTAPTGGGVRG